MSYAKSWHLLITHWWKPHYWGTSSTHFRQINYTGSSLTLLWLPWCLTTVATASDYIVLLFQSEHPPLVTTVWPLNENCYIFGFLDHLQFVNGASLVTKPAKLPNSGLRVKMLSKSLPSCHLDLWSSEKSFLSFTSHRIQSLPLSLGISLAVGLCSRYLCYVSTWQDWTTFLKISIDQFWLVLTAGWTSISVLAIATLVRGRPSCWTHA